MWIPDCLDAVDVVAVVGVGGVVVGVDVVVVLAIVPLATLSLSSSQRFRMSLFPRGVVFVGDTVVVGYADSVGRAEVYLTCLL